MTGTRLPVLGALAGALVGAALAVSLVATGVLRTPTVRDLSDAHEPFLAAWARSRTGTFIVQSEFRRTIDGRTLYSPTELVQRPPDRIVRQFGGVSGTVNGHPIVCSTDQSNTFSCRESEQTAPPYEDQVQREVDDLRAMVTPPEPGAKPLYRVIRGVDEGCFELIRQYPLDDAPYGTYGKLCFDATTGAQTELERRLDRGVVERQHAVSISTDVIDHDFDTSSDEGYGLSMDLPAPVVQGGGTTMPPDPGSTTTTTTTPAPSADELAQLDFATLLTRSTEADGDALVPYASEAVMRLINGRASINDEHWWGADGQPIPLALPVVKVLLAQGVVSFG